MLSSLLHGNSRSNNVAIYISEEEPTDSSLSFLYVPYSRVIPDEDAVTLEYENAELVRNHM